MALFSRNHKQPPRLPGGIPAEATIRVSEPAGEQWSRESGGLPIELNHFGTRDYRLVLEIDSEIHGKYLTDGHHAVPRRAENTGLLAPSVGNHLTAGLGLPVVVNPMDPQHVEIDWPAFLSDPDRKKKQKAAYQADYTARVALAQVENARDPAPKRRRNNSIAVLAWADAVRQGSLSPAAFDKAVEEAISNSSLSPADADAARMRLS